MRFGDITIVDPYVEKGWTPEIRLTLSTVGEVKSVESQLNVRFPNGYEEYVTTLGFGDYCSYIRIDMPSKVLSGYKDYQEFLNEYWFWDLSKETFSKQRALESIILGSTVDGDAMMFHPSNRKELFVLPRHDDISYCIGSDLYEAIDWLCVSRHNPDSGRVGETHDRRYFVPDNPYAYTHGTLRPQGF